MKKYLINLVKNSSSFEIGYIEAENGREIAEKLGLEYGWQSSTGKDNEYHQFYIKKDGEHISLTAFEIKEINSDMITDIIIATRT